MDDNLAAAIVLVAIALAVLVTALVAIIGG